MRAALVLAAFLAAAPLHARPIDRGGSISEYRAAIRSAHGVHVISGDCYSACTMWLGYARSCVTSDARLWFHSAWSDWRGRVEPSPVASAIMASYYPGQMRRMVSLHGWLASPHWNSISGREAIGLGAHACKS